jgi:hypothetical protein
MHSTSWIYGGILVVTKLTRSEFHKMHTICATGIHMKRSVAVHPDREPIKRAPSADSFPNLACIHDTIE